MIGSTTKVKFARWTTCSALIFAALACNAVADSRFEFSADGRNVKLEVRDVPLRDVLRRLLDGTNVDVKWLDPAVGSEPITGDFSGRVTDVVRQLLRRTDFTIAYSGNDQLSRVIVLGASGSIAHAAPGVAAMSPSRHIPSAAPVPRTAETGPPGHHVPIAAAPQVRPAAPAGPPGQHVPMTRPGPTP